MGDPVRVLLVDDDPMVRGFLRTVLDSSGQVEVTGEAEDGADAVEAVVRDRPDVVLMDLRMPEVDGVTATAEIRSLPDPPQVVVMTTFDTDDDLLAALEAGANGYLLKSTPADALVKLVLAAAAGISVLSPEALQRLKEQPGTAPSDPRIAALPDREREILALARRRADQRRHRSAALPERRHGQGPRVTPDDHPRLPEQDSARPTHHSVPAKRAGHQITQHAGRGCCRTSCALVRFSRRTQRNRRVSARHSRAQRPLPRRRPARRTAR